MDEGRVFLLNFKMYNWVYVGFLVVGLFFCLFTRPLDRYLVTWISILIGSMIFGFFYNYLMRKLYPTFVDRGGIRAFSFWGRKLEIAWEDIGDAKLAWIYLRLFSISQPTKVVYVLTGYLDDPRGYYESVESRAPEGSLIHRFAEDELARKATASRLRKS